MITHIEYISTLFEPIHWVFKSTLTQMCRRIVSLSGEFLVIVLSAFVEYEGSRPLTLFYLCTLLWLPHSKQTSTHATVETRLSLDLNRGYFLLHIGRKSVFPPPSRLSRKGHKRRWINGSRVLWRIQFSRIKPYRITSKEGTDESLSSLVLSRVESQEWIRVPTGVTGTCLPSPHRVGGRDWNWLIK